MSISKNIDVKIAIFYKYSRFSYKLYPKRLSSAKSEMLEIMSEWL